MFADFIKKIQNSDNQTKQRFLVLGTALSMIIVIILWLLYMKSEIKAVNFAQVTENQNKPETFFDLFKNNFQAVWNSIKHIFKRE